MSKPTLYLETTVIGHIAARPRHDVVVAARQFASQRWWETRDDYEIFVSQIVLDECADGDQFAAAERLQLIGNLAVLDIPTDAKGLSQQLIQFHGIPATEPRDALHIAIAAFHGLQYLLTWNFRHIANANTRNLIEKITRDAGYTPPTICSPDELLGA